MHGVSSRGVSRGPDSDRRGINSQGPAAHVLLAACDEVLRNSTLLLATPLLVSQTVILPKPPTSLSQNPQQAPALSI